MIIFIIIQFVSMVTFNKKIVIKPNREYLFGQWEQRRSEQIFTLIPPKELENYLKSKSLSNEPKKLKDIITEILDDIRNMDQG